mmetsp:Transcript_9891/g.16538  ORF Transcript_9891/g.16538 Transcript_9891/m.16538 type:complete len:81 (+) Transcript_9891:3-245(+)
MVVLETSPNKKLGEAIGQRTFSLIYAYRPGTCPTTFMNPSFFSIHAPFAATIVCRLTSVRTGAELDRSFKNRATSSSLFR